MCRSQVHGINGPFLRDWSRITTDRDLRLHPLHMSKDYACAFAFCKVERNVTSWTVNRICHDLEVRLYHAPRSI